MSESTSGRPLAGHDEGISRRVGDVCVVFGSDGIALRNRGAERVAGSWEGEAGRPRLVEFECSESWRGFPLQTAEKENVSTWLLGEIYAESDPVRGALETLRGQRSPAALNGHFLLIGYDGNRREWSVITDRFGTIHAYYGARGNRAVVGTNFPAVAAAMSRREFDWLGIAGFFGMGFFPDDRTFYNDVRILKPASRYVFDDDGALVSQARYWSWPSSTLSFGSPAEALEAFGETFLEVMQEMLDGDRIAIPISGGLDSRSTVAAIDPELTDVGRFWSFSYGYGARSIEPAIGRQVAKARGLTHASYQIRPYLFEQLETVMSSVEGFQDITQCRQAAVVAELTKHADWLIAAHVGDLWLDAEVVDKNVISEKRLSEVALERMWKRGGGWLLKRLCEPHMGSEQPYESVRQVLAAQLAGIPQDHEPAFRLKALKTETWVFRQTLASLRMYQAAVFPRLPFIDSRVSNVLTAVPSSWLVGRRLQIEFLKRYAPDLARIKWQAYDTDLYSYHRFGSWHLPRRAVKKAWRAVQKESPVERNWEIQLLGESGERGLQEWLLRKGLQLHELLPRREVEDLLARFRVRKHDPALGYTVSMLLTFSAWLELHG